LGIEPRDVLERVRSAEEIAAMLDASHEEGLIEEFQHDLLTGALDFAERNVRSVMVPWRDAVTVGRDDPVAAIEAVVSRTGHTRLPVVVAPPVGPVEDDTEVAAVQVAGFVHAKDLLGTGVGERERPLPLERVRPVFVVTAETGLEELLDRMRQERVHLAVVCEENDGRPIGLVTLEDLVEELVGELRDESDPTSGPDERW
jgi:CBS domain containing-hemolysin-like protein